MCRWANYFREGGQDLEDDPRSGRPATAMTNENIDRIRQLIQDNPHISYAHMEAETFLCRATIHIIIVSSMKNLKRENYHRAGSPLNSLMRNEPNE